MMFSSSYSSRCRAKHCERLFRWWSGCKVKDQKKICLFLFNNFLCSLFLYSFFVCVSFQDIWCVFFCLVVGQRAAFLCVRSVPGARERKKKEKEIDRLISRTWQLLRSSGCLNGTSYGLWCPSLLFFTLIYYTRFSFHRLRRPPTMTVRVSLHRVRLHRRLSVVIYCMVLTAYSNNWRITYRYRFKLGRCCFVVVVVRWRVKERNYRGARAAV